MVMGRQVTSRSGEATALTPGGGAAPQPGRGEAALLVVVCVGMGQSAIGRSRLPGADGGRWGGRWGGRGGELLQDRLAGQPLALWTGAFLTLIAFLAVRVVRVAVVRAARSAWSRDAV